jgi:predicted nucleotidyltransferase
LWDSATLEWSALAGKVAKVKTLDPQKLDEAIQRLVAALRPEQIYLYGSHAYGRPSVDSDLDLLIVLADSDLPPHRRAVTAYRALRGLCLPAEIRVVTREEFARRASWFSTVERVALEKGQVLYAAHA